MDATVQIERELSPMLSPRGAFDLALVVVATTALGVSAWSCKSKPAGALDGGSDAFAALGDEGGAGDAGDGGVVESATAVASATPPPPAFAPEPPSTPFTGTYRCFKGMHLEQAGTIVTSTMHNGTTDTVVACTVSREDCIGTVREIQMTRGKAPKVMHVKPITLHRTPNGDIMFQVAPAPGAHQTNPSKPAPGAQTFCPRR
jgi:hypothetical protein